MNSSNAWWCFPFEAIESLSVHLMWVAAATYCAIIAPKSLLATLIGVLGMAHFSLGKRFWFLLFISTVQHNFNVVIICQRPRQWKFFWWSIDWNSRNQTIIQIDGPFGGHCRCNIWINALFLASQIFRDYRKIKRYTILKTFLTFLKLFL